MPSLILPFLFLSVGMLSPGSIAWTPSSWKRTMSSPLRSTTMEPERTVNRIQSRLFMSLSLPDDEESSSSSSSSIDGFQLTTRTRKVLQFDDNTGRFFETEIDAPATDTFATTTTTTTTTATATSTVVPNNFPPHELVPTEILFGRERQPQSKEGGRRREPLPLDDVDISSVSDNDNNDNNYNDKYVVNEEKINDDNSNQQKTREKSIVEECYDAWNRRDFDAVINCFSNSFTYHDSLYYGQFASSNDKKNKNKDELKQHFISQSKLLPKNSHIIIDHIAICPTTGNIGTQWHVKNIDTNTIVPYTRGCSFYTTAEDNNTGRRVIASGFRTSEMFIKPSKEFANRLVGSVPSTSSSSTSLSNDNSKSTTSSSSSNNNNGNENNVNENNLSIIEQYFNAWNERDIERAVNCFVDECTYQTEDPVFVDTMYGKNALRHHLLKNVESLPSSCEIILDNIALDPINGTIGTCWHLQIQTGMNGITIPIPNLRGCSMYTIDSTTGLLKSGYDITESPVKLPKQIISSSSSLSSLLNLPARLLFGS